MGRKRDWSAGRRPGKLLPLGRPGQPHLSDEPKRRPGGELRLRRIRPGPVRQPRDRAALRLHRLPVRQNSRDLLCPGQGVQAGVGKICRKRRIKKVRIGGQLCLYVDICISGQQERAINRPSTGLPGTGGKCKEKTAIIPTTVWDTGQQASCAQLSFSTCS